MPNMRSSGRAGEFRSREKRARFCTWEGAKTQVAPTAIRITAIVYAGIVEREEQRCRWEAS